MEFKHDVNIEQDIKECFGKDSSEILLGQQGNVLKKRVFEKADSLDRASLHNLYCSEAYLPELLCFVTNNWFSQINSMSLDSNPVWVLAKTMYPNPKGIRVLDYGCGTGYMGLRLAMEGYDVTFMDLPHHYFRFLRHIATKYFPTENLHFKSISHAEQDVEGMYDYIICSEMLEHVDEPEPVLEHLYNHLEKKGWMYLSTFFDDVGGEDPSHLKRNTRRYNNSTFFLGLVAKRGLIPLWRDNNNTEKGFQKLF